MEMMFVIINMQIAHLYFSFSSSAGDAVQVFERCLGSIMDWMKVNKLKFLNPEKNEVLLLGGSLDWLEGLYSPLKDQFPEHSGSKMWASPPQTVSSEIGDSNHFLRTKEQSPQILNSMEDLRRILW